jgi:hypothetical protein
MTEQIVGLTMRRGPRPSGAGFLITLAVLAVAFPTFGTEQARDIVTFAGQHDSILEHPLNEFLSRLPAIPRFDIPSTADYKGYTATWEVKDSRLYLATFHATTNRQPYSISSLFPGQKVPIQAEWYSGTVHIISDSETLTQGRYVYERITVLQVTNGVVIATNRISDWFYDFTANRSATCEVHGIAMSFKILDLKFGMKSLTEIMKARRKLFPHADEPYDTGFCMPLREQRGRVFVCTRCTEARITWMSTHKTR